MSRLGLLQRLAPARVRNPLVRHVYVYGLVTAATTTLLHLPMFGGDRWSGALCAVSPQRSHALPAAQPSGLFQVFASQLRLLLGGGFFAGADGLLPAGAQFVAPYGDR